MILSIVVPIYNVSEYLEECLDSIINQSLKDIEIILVNDCSPDNNDELICLNYKNKDSRIKYIKHEINKGVSEARNTGIKAATGKYISFIDPDDFLSDINIYKKVIDILESNDKINFVGFNYQTYHMDNNEINDIDNYLDLYYEEASEIDLSKNIHTLVVTNKIFRHKDIIDNNLIFKLKFAEDLMFIMEYFYKVKPVYKFLKEYAYMYRIRKGSLCTTYDLKEVLPAHIKVFEYVKSVGLYEVTYNHFYKLYLSNFLFKYYDSYLVDDNFCCAEDYIKLINFINIDDSDLTKLIYRKFKYKIVVDNKEKFQKLFPGYSVKSKFYYKLHRVFYFAFKGILFAN